MLRMCAQKCTDHQTSSFQSTRVAYSDHSSSPVCGFGSAKPVLLRPNSTEPTWRYHIHGWINDLNMLLSCFRTKMSGHNHNHAQLQSQKGD